MILNEKLNIVVIPALIFAVLAASNAWSYFSEPWEFDVHKMKRCVAACRLARPVGEDKRKELLQHWIGESWEHMAYGEKEEKPVVVSLPFRQEFAEEFLGKSNGLFGVLVAKGREIILAFSGTALWETEDWKKQNEQPTKCCRDVEGGEEEGVGHWGSLKLWEAFKGGLAGGQDNNEITKYMNLFNRGLENNRQVPLTTDNFQVIVVGHSLGGMVAQRCAPGILEKVFKGEDNSKNNVAVVTLGSPRVFDERGAKVWDESMGGPEKHLRVVGQKDTFWEHCSGKFFTGVTGKERVLDQSEFGLGTGLPALLTDGKVHHYLRCYEDLLNAGTRE